MLSKDNFEADVKPFDSGNVLTLVEVSEHNNSVPLEIKLQALVEAATKQPPPEISESKKKTSPGKRRDASDRKQGKKSGKDSRYMSHATEKQTSRSFSLPYQKRDWRAGIPLLV